MSVCRVCSDENAQHHYGTICCPSCKGFFRRVFLSNVRLTCYKGNCCVINKTSRNACRACRYKKCLLVGMDSKDIRGKASDSNIALPDIDDAEDEKCLATVDEAKRIINLLLNLDRFCEQMTISENAGKEEDQLIQQMLNSSVKELIDNSCPQCPRFPRIWKPLEMVDVHTFKRSWARDIVNFLDWAHNFPAFRGLSGQDKIEAFVGRFTQFSVFCKCFRTYREGCSGLLFGCGSVFPYEKSARQQITNDHLRKFLSGMTDRLFADVIFSMTYIEMDEGDFVLALANLVLHDGVELNRMSQHGQDAFATERSKHREALMEHLSRRETADENLNRVIHVENMLAAVEAVSRYIDQEIHYMQFYNLLDINQKLFIECHQGKIKLDI